MSVPARFTPPPPPDPPAPEDLSGFSIGVLRLAWKHPAMPYEIAGHQGRAFVAALVEVRTGRGHLRTSDARASLHGAVVRAPDGELSKIVGVEAYLTPSLAAPMDLGILLVPVDDSNW